MLSAVDNGEVGGGMGKLGSLGWRQWWWRASVGGKEEGKLGIMALCKGLGVDRGRGGAEGDNYGDVAICGKTLEVAEPLFRMVEGAMK